jgi:hypothetical protein
MLVRRLGWKQAQKTKCMLLSYQQDARKNHDMKVANRSFDYMAQFRYLGMRITNQNLMKWQ